MKRTSPVEIDSLFAPQEEKKASPEPRRQAAHPIKPKKKSRSRASSAKTRRNRQAFAILLPLTILIAFGAFFVLLGLNYFDYMQMRRTVSSSTLLPGTTVEGIDVSGMTLEEALDYWDNNIEPAYRSVSVTVEGVSPVTSEQLGYSSDYRAVLSRAYGQNRYGTLSERYDAICAQGTATDYAVTRSLSDDSVVMAYVNAFGDATDREPKNASVQGFDSTNYTFTFSTGVSGVTLDRLKLAQDITSALASGGGTVTPSLTTTQPSVTVDDLSSRYGLIASAVTNASSSSSNRLNNIRLALAAVNGTCIEPGDTFSYNDTVGERTTARGYKSAPAYSAGEVIEEVGGGICQVSTTLFNAAAKSGLEIVERHNHSIPVSYVDKGKDATVSWGIQDLRFKNTTDADIYIAAYLSDDKRVYIAIFGLKRTDGLTLSVEPVITDTEDYETTYQENYFLPSGTKNTLKKGRKGYEVTTYLVYKDESGNTVKKEVLCKSDYPKQDCVIEVGTG